MDDNCRCSEGRICAYCCGAETCEQCNGKGNILTDVEYEGRLVAGVIGCPGCGGFGYCLSKK